VSHHAGVINTPIKKYFITMNKPAIASLDPAFAKNQSIMWAVHQLYNTLVEVDENMQLKPSLAKNWEISADNLSLIFHLRTDIFFMMMQHLKITKEDN
jgi:peptide/nickel transport system substrate-binding protein